MVIKFKKNYLKIKNNIATSNVHIDVQINLKFKT